MNLYRVTVRTPQDPQDYTYDEKELYVAAKDIDEVLEKIDSHLTEKNLYPTAIYLMNNSIHEEFVE